MSKSPNKTRSNVYLSRQINNNIIVYPQLIAEKTQEALDSRCLCKMLWIRWQDRVRNANIAIHTGLPSIMTSSVKGGRSSVFCHVARLLASTQAHQALKLQVDLSLNRFPCSAHWKRRPGRPHGRWVDQLRQYSRPMAFCHQERPSRSDAMVLVDYALTTTKIVDKMYV